MILSCEIYGDERSDRNNFEMVSVINLLTNGLRFRIVHPHYVIRKTIPYGKQNVKKNLIP